MEDLRERILSSLFRHHGVLRSPAIHHYCVNPHPSREVSTWIRSWEEGGLVDFEVMSRPKFQPYVFLSTFTEGEHADSLTLILALAWPQNPPQASLPGWDGKEPDDNPSSIGYLC